MASEPWRGKAVLIVDDSPGVRESLGHAFRAVGMQVVGTAENGVKALEKMRSAEADLVSLDLIMPEMDGIECYHRMRAEFPRARIVVISWLGGEAKILENLKGQIPAELIQAKPVSADILRQRLARVYGVAAPEASARSLDVPGPKAASNDDDDFQSLGVKVV